MFIEEVEAWIGAHRQVFERDLPLSEFVNHTLELIHGIYQREFGRDLQTYLDHIDGSADAYKWAVTRFQGLAIDCLGSDTSPNENNRWVLERRRQLGYQPRPQIRMSTQQEIADDDAFYREVQAYNRNRGW
jgi:hypothetical protein